MAKWQETEYYHLVEKFWGGRCVYCFEIIEGVITRDHFIPKSKKGENHKFNLVPACATCNTAKCNTHPNTWCSDAQRNQVARYLNALLLHDVQLYRTTSLPANVLEGRYHQYKQVRKRFMSTVRNLSILELNLTFTPKKKKSKKRSVNQIIQAWEAGDVTEGGKHIRESDFIQTSEGVYTLH